MTTFPKNLQNLHLEGYDKPILFKSAIDDDFQPEVYEEDSNEPRIFMKAVSIASYDILKICLPLKDIIAIINHEIVNLPETYKRLYEEEISSREHIPFNNSFELIQFPKFPKFVERHTPLIKETKLLKLCKFYWEFKVEHVIPEKPDSISETQYESFMEQEKRNTSRVEIFIYRDNPSKNTDTKTNYFICMNRLFGRSYSYTDFTNALKIHLKKKKDMGNLYDLREPLIKLQYYRENTHIIKYITNELIIREVCSFIGLPEEENTNTSYFYNIFNKINVI